MILLHSRPCQHIHLQNDDKVQCTYKINCLLLPYFAMLLVNSILFIFLKETVGGRLLNRAASHPHNNNRSNILMTLLSKVHETWIFAPLLLPWRQHGVSLKPRLCTNTASPGQEVDINHAYIKVSSYIIQQMIGLDFIAPRCIGLHIKYTFMKPLHLLNVLRYGVNTPREWYEDRSADIEIFTSSCINLINDVLCFIHCNYKMMYSRAETASRGQ